MFKPNSIGACLVGIVVGVTVFLSLVFTTLGHVWWQDVISLVIGVVAGLVAADYRIFPLAVKSVFADYAAKKSSRRPANMKVGFLKIVFVCSVLLRLGLTVICIFISVLAVSRVVETEYFLAPPATLLWFVFLLFSLFFWFSVWLLPYGLTRSGKMKKRLGDFSLDNFFAVFREKCRFYQNEKEGGWLWEEGKLFVANLFFVPYTAWCFLRSFAVAIIFVFGFVYTIVLAGCLILRFVWQEDHLSLVTICIVAGALCGVCLGNVLWQHFLIGNIVAVVPFLISVAFSHFENLRNLKNTSHVLEPCEALCWKIIG